jgi:D-ribose pyranose/furanose isomerase RbsD
MNTLSKSERINCALRHETLKSIYNCSLLPKLLYAAPVWIESIIKECNRAKYIRVQRLISLRRAKTYRTISHETLCVLSGLTRINIKAEEVVTLYNIITGRNNQKYQMDVAEKQGIGFTQRI